MNTNENTQIEIELYVRQLVMATNALLSEDGTMPISAKNYISENFMKCLGEIQQSLNIIQNKLIADCQVKGTLMSQATLRSFTETLNFIYRTKQHLEQVSSEFEKTQSLATAVFQKRYVVAWSQDMKNHIKKLSASLNLSADFDLEVEAA